MVHSQGPLYKYYAVCPKGLEDLLGAEIVACGGHLTAQSVGVVHFDADHRALYTVCLWSRIANRVFFTLINAKSSIPVENNVSLYSAAKSIPWELHFSTDQRFSVDFIGTSEAINNTQYGAVCVKDAIVDRFREQTGHRPDVDKSDPDIRIQVRLHKGRIQVGLDMSGGSLHQRGYRMQQGRAPLKENVAAAVLLRCGWSTRPVDGRLQLIDPMCGSGTLLIEAAEIALDVAPALRRTSFGFQRWAQYQEPVWEGVYEEALQRRSARASQLANRLVLRGYDADSSVVNMAKVNIDKAGFGELIDVRQGGIEAFSIPVETVAEGGLVVCNPPYGERLGEIEALRPLYFTLAKQVKEHCPGWQLGILTANSELAREMRMRPKKVNKLFNGALPCELFLYDVLSASAATLREDYAVVPESALTDGARMVLNRLRKNQRKLKAWLEREDIHAYRLYDADMPEYSAAVDVYEGRIHVQEYAAPKDLPADVATRRLRELVLACAVAFSCAPDDISVKVRQRNSGKKQYEKIADRRTYFSVKEGAAQLQVNLWDYLDTGLFLDHRPLRQRIYAEARGKRFLNLFCYTASASVHAALGGAASTLSVDMSKTYLQWAAENFALNHINTKRHHLLQSDCVKWLEHCREGFDLIMLDPPSFSNSKRMDDVLDVQRDHVWLIKRCLDILNPGGTLYFSTNLRSFRLDGDSLARYAVEDISAQTLDADFVRNPKIHRCYKISRK